MPRNQHGFKVVDDDNEEAGRKFRGPAVNRVTLVGRLASDPELHALSAWGKLAEFAGSNLKKGRLLYLEGRRRPSGCGNRSFVFVFGGLLF